MSVATPPVTQLVVRSVLRRLAPLPGFAASAYCLDGVRTGCDLPRGTVWTGYAEWRGPRLGREPGRGPAGRDAPRAFYLVGVSAHRSPAQAQSLARAVSRRSPGGRVREPVRRQGGRTYSFGRHGRAVLRTAHAAGWTGVVSVGRVDLLRPGEPPVRDVVQVDSTLHRGRVSVQLIGWVDGRARGPDPAVALDTLTQEVLRRLDRPYAALRRARSG
ncbi:MAG: hypothetical protein JWR42_2601 [Marmoricola sp.]|nr:hypothetical protein [Marmoricola sp.]